MQKVRTQPFFALAPEERIRRTAALAQASGTDMDRWSDKRNLDPRWAERARRAAGWIQPAWRVLDLGAGAQLLRHFLHDGCEYIPSDVIARTNDTLVADLNQHQFPSGNFDAVVALGVLEYIHDLEWLLARMREASPVAIVSYSASRDGLLAPRLGLGWMNHLALPDVYRLIGSVGWTVVSRVLLDEAVSHEQWLMKLEDSVGVDGWRDV